MKSAPSSITSVSVSNNSVCIAIVKDVKYAQDIETCVPNLEFCILSIDVAVSNECGLSLGPTYGFKDFLSNAASPEVFQNCVVPLSVKSLPFLTVHLIGQMLCCQ